MGHEGKGPHDADPSMKITTVDTVEPVGPQIGQPHVFPEMDFARSAGYIDERGNLTKEGLDFINVSSRKPEIQRAPARPKDASTKPRAHARPIRFSVSPAMRPRETSAIVPLDKEPDKKATEYDPVAFQNKANKVWNSFVSSKKGKIKGGDYRVASDVVPGTYKIRFLKKIDQNEQASGADEYVKPENEKELFLITSSNADGLLTRLKMMLTRTFPE